MTPVLKFDEASHTYTLDGVELPSVSKVIEPLYDSLFTKLDPAVVEKSRNRGRAIHKTIELFELGRLNPKTTHPYLLRCLDQWLDFKKVMGFVVRRTERQVYSIKRGYAGTFDTDGHIGVLNGSKGEEMLLDLKSGAKYEPHKAQTAGYKIAGVEMGLLSPDCRRSSLYISDDSWEIEYHYDDMDGVAFLSLITILKWRANHAKRR